MKKPYTVFNTSEITLKPLATRTNDLALSGFPSLDSKALPYENRELEQLCSDLRRIKDKKKTIVFAMGAHVIRSGAACYIIDLMKRGYISHICFNGACAIHDYELALVGGTTESVARYITTGEFGMWTETGYINDYIRDGLDSGYGFGQALGHAITERNLPYREQSILYHAYQLEIPVTVHVSIGYDIIHQHPNCDGAALGMASYRDFLVFAETVKKIEGGAYISAGTAVMGPEIFLKALSMARNVLRKQGKTIGDVTTAVFDMYPIEPAEAGHAPEKSDPRYYFRPWKTLLVRTVQDGGKSYYVRGRHEETFPAMYRLLTSE